MDPLPCRRCNGSGQEVPLLSREAARAIHEAYGFPWWQRTWLAVLISRLARAWRVIRTGDEYADPS